MTSLKGPGWRPGVIDVIPVYGVRRSVAECAECGEPRWLKGRGLCSRCYDPHYRDGTLEEFGCVPAGRRADFAELRRSGLSISAAGRKLGISAVTAFRYERRARDDGTADWRQQLACPITQE